MQEMENKVRKAFEHATPNVLDSVLSDCREQKGTAMTTTRKQGWSKKLLAVAAALALIIGLGAAYGWYDYNNAPLAAVSFDVNPSIQITVNRQEKVLEAEALNEDAQLVLEDMDLEGSHINVAVNAILGSMLRNGFLTADANTILVSVNSRDAAAGAALQEKLTGQIGQLLTENNFAGAVMSQTVTGEKNNQSLAKQYGISEGKAQLINRIIAADGHYTFENLAKLSINELKLLTETPKLDLDNVTSSGQASANEYISQKEALAIVLENMKAEAEQLRDLEAEFDCEGGRMIYEVDFDYNGKEYEYHIDARTGQILKSNWEPEDDKPEKDPVVQPAEYITPEQAQTAALTHAGLSADQVRELESELDTDDGKAHYDVDFKTAEYEYEYEIDAVTGQVLKDRKEFNDDKVTDEPAVQPTEYITPEQAKTAALTHAGLSADQVRELECELDRENGKTVYEVTFEKGNTEYEYEIDAVTGQVIRHEAEKDD